MESKVKSPKTVGRYLWFQQTLNSCHPGTVNLGLGELWDKLQGQTGERTVPWEPRSPNSTSGSSGTLLCPTLTSPLTSSTALSSLSSPVLSLPQFNLFRSVYAVFLACHIDLISLNFLRISLYNLLRCLLHYQIFSFFFTGVFDRQLLPYF